MDLVLRGLIIYLFLLLIFRIAGRRSMAQMTNFDFVLLLIISEATQQSMLGEDYSLTGGMIVIATLIAVDIGMSLLKRALPAAAKWIDGVPTVLIEDGHLHRDRMKKARVDESDILNDARALQGLERLDQIKYAVLERNGEITVVPKERED